MDDLLKQKRLNVVSIIVFQQGHSSFVTHIDWSCCGQYLRSNSGDYEVLYCKSFFYFTLQFIILVSLFCFGETIDGCKKNILRGESKKGPSVYK